MTKLKDKVTFYVPSEPRLGLSTARVMAEILAKEYGGATIVKADGHWLDSKGELIAEPILLVYAFGNFSADSLAGFRSYAEGIRLNLGQESVAFELNGILYLV